MYLKVPVQSLQRTTVWISKEEGEKVVVKRGTTQIGGGDFSPLMWDDSIQWQFISKHTMKLMIDITSYLQNKKEILRWY